MDKDNVDTTGKPHQVFVDMRQMKSVRVMNTALKIAYLRITSWSEYLNKVT